MAGNKRAKVGPGEYGLSRFHCRVGKTAEAAVNLSCSLE